ncbi:hypothetical protein, partial [Pseudomonas sp. PAB10]|uniref:hypothetical protein n=1 Tax=Pseudomonas sp. PAB10 TaxID=3233047 RepID=UPI003F9B68D7
MAKNELVTNEDEDQHILWIEPYILTPNHGSTVSPGFLIEAIVTVPPASKWRVQFFYGPNMIKEFQGAPFLGSAISFNVPSNLIQPGRDFYFRLDYAKRMVAWDTWSDWAYSGDLKMAGAGKPPSPRIEAPQAGSIHSPGLIDIRGTCAAGAKVELLSWDNSFLDPATVRGTTWSSSGRVWDAGTKHVKARQILNNLASDPSAQLEFIVGTNAKPPEPTIFSPEQGKKYPVGSLAIMGTCLEGAQVEVLNFDNSKLGDAKVTGATWSYSRVWDAGTKHVKARQIVDRVASDPSAQLEFYIVAMSQPAAPIIEAPLQDSTHNVGNVTIKGTCLEGAVVDVLSWDDSKLAVAEVNGRVWTLNYTWDTGFKHVKARQTVHHWRSDPSPERAFIVGTPGKPPEPLITYPESGSKHAVGIVEIRGTCLERATVEVLSWDNSKLGDAQVTGKTWVYPYTWDVGVKHVKARQTEYGKVSDPSREIEFTVGDPAPPPSPAISKPQEASTALFGKVKIEGTCLARATVELLASDNTKLGDAVVSDTEWFIDVDWLPGPKHIKARQTEYGRVSLPSNLLTFYLRPPQLVITQPTSPVDHNHIIGGTEGYPGATLKMLDSANQPVPGRFTQNGKSWTFAPDQPWEVGSRTIKAVQTVNSVESNASGPRTFKVRPPQLVITQPTSPVDQNHVISGTEGYPGATLKMLDSAN